MDDTDFITILAWMRRLNMSGVEKIIYAIIYGFSKDRRSDFHGSRQYLADWCECSTKTVERALAHLLEMRYIIKREEVMNGVKFCRYTVNFDTPDKLSIHWTKCLGGSANLSKMADNMSHNNIVDNIDNNIAADNAHTRETKDTPKKFDYKIKLIEAGVSPENAERLMTNRKSAGLKNTEAAYNKLMGALEQVCNGYGVTTDEAIAFAGKKGWGFIDPSWNLEGLRAQSPRSRKALSIDQLLNNEFGHADK